MTGRCLLLLFPVTSQHEKRGRSDSSSELHVYRFIANNKGLSCIEAQVSRRVQCHAGSRFAAIASVVRQVRAKVNAVEFHPFVPKKSIQPIMYPVQRMQVEKP